MQTLTSSLFSIIFIFTSFACYPSSKSEIDQYNEATLTLLDDLDSCLLRVNYTIKEAENIGYAYGQGYGWYLKGYIQRMKEELGKAFVANLKGLTVLQDESSKRASKTLVKLYLNTGEILSRHFKYEEANEYFLEGRAIAENENFDRWVIKFNYSIGVNYKKLGDLPKANDYLNEAIKGAYLEKDEYTLVNSLNQMGLICKKINNLDTAAIFFNKMLQYSYVDVNADEYKGVAYHNLANLYAQKGDTVKAFLTFNKALDHLEATNIPSETFITELDMAELFYLQGDYDKAQQLIEKCIQQYDIMRLHPDHYKVFDIARKISFALNEPTLVNNHVDGYIEESTEFIIAQQKLIDSMSQYKMDILTAAYFSELEKDKRIHHLKIAMIWIAVVLTGIIIFLKLRQIWMKRVVTKALKNLVGK